VTTTLQLTPSSWKALDNALRNIDRKEEAEVDMRMAWAKWNSTERGVNYLDSLSLSFISVADLNYLD
jgi:hypothetical protein